MGKAKCSLGLTVNMQVPELHSVLKKLGADERGDVQKLVTRECFERVKGYMPRLTGELADNRTKVEDDSHIRTEGPHARFLFFGVTRLGLPVDYTTLANPNAGGHWDRRLAAAEGAAIAAKAQKYIDGRGRRGR